MWVCNGSGTLIDYTPEQQMTGSPSPTVTISNPAQGPAVLELPNGIAFDNNGSLWVANSTNSEGVLWDVVQYSKAQLAVSGSPLPTITIAHQSGSNANGIAFDSKGNMWIAQDVTVLEFTAADITQSGTPTRDH